MMLIINHYTLETDIDRDSYFWTLLLNLPTEHLRTYLYSTYVKVSAQINTAHE